MVGDTGQVGADPSDIAFILAWVNENKDAIGVFLTAVGLVVAGGWAAFTYFRKPKEQNTPSVRVGTGIGTVGTISGGTFNFGITLDQHEDRLRKREAEIRAELREASVQERALLEAELNGVEQKLANLQSDYEETKKRLAEAMQVLEHYRERFTAEQFAFAQEALRQGDLKTAEELFEKAAVANEDQAAHARFEVARLAEQRIDYRKALENYNIAAALAPGNALFLRCYADLAKTMGLYTEARPYYGRALAIQEQALGPEHIEVATTLNNLAGLYEAQGKYIEAEPRYQRALAILETALGPKDPDVAMALNNLALLYGAQCKYAMAEPLYQRARTVAKKALGPEHPFVATVLNNLAELYRVQDHHPRPSRCTCAR